MPGAGKSTIGVILAKSMGFNFVDTDLVIQKIQQQQLQTIINEKGMAEFLEIEKEAVLTLKDQKAVIATGGSVVYKDAAMQHLKSFSRVIFLELPLNIIEERISNITTRGIAMGPNKNLADIYSERVPLYVKYADNTINCLNKSAEQIVTEIMGVIENSY
jgi:shikimate kinase